MCGQATSSRCARTSHCTCAAHSLQLTTAHSFLCTVSCATRCRSGSTALGPCAFSSSWVVCWPLPLHRFSIPRAARLPNRNQPQLCRFTKPVYATETFAICNAGPAVHGAARGSGGAAAGGQQRLLVEAQRHDVRRFLRGARPGNFLLSFLFIFLCKWFCASTMA